MKLAIVGGRDFDDYAGLKAVVDRVKTPITLIVSGAASGADSLARRYAQEHGIPLQEFPADWKTHGKRAGYLRNVDIISASDAVIAFWDGVSPGTESSIKLTKQQGKPIHIVDYD